jgi:imidazolonepropionase-like amidohydrolase
MLVLDNAKIFDGRKMRAETGSVAIAGDTIVAVGHVEKPAAAQVIDVKGCTVMPGLITGHLHPDFYRFSLAQGFAGEQLGKELPPGVLMAIGVRTCRVLLESGFTGYIGAGCGHDIDAQLKMAIADEIIPGPRIRACGHHIGTTGDFNNTKKWWQRFETPGTDLVADGPLELRKLVRDEIRRGAEIIKIFVSSGRGYPGKAMRNMARDEIQAVVDAAHGLGARVRAHVCDKALMLECIEFGVDIIDHGDDIDEQVIDAMIRAGTFWVPSLVYPKLLIDMNMADAQLQAQYRNACNMLPVAHEAGVRILIGDDYSGVFRGVLDDDPLDHQVGCYAREIAFYSAFDGISAEDVLGWGTRNAGALLVDAPQWVGVIEAGALADLIIVDGDPVADPALLAQPRQYLRAVIRDGAFAIDRLQAGR